MRGEVALGVERLRKTFDGVEALRGVSLTVARGERRALIGPNGAGKSTLFRIISGEARPTAGRVHLHGREITGLSPEDTAALGLARTFQHSSPFPRLTVEENAALAVLARQPGRWNVCRPLDGFGPVLAEARAGLEGVGLGAKGGLPAAVLAHGERRLLELAMALLQRPAVLLLDEPAAGLVGSERDRVGAVLRGLPRHMTVLLIEHDLDFAFSLADTVTVLHNGEVVAEGTPGEVRRDGRVQDVYTGGSARSPSLPPRPPARGAGGPVLRVEDLHVAYGTAPVLRGVSLEVGRGEIAAVLGRNGTGKTTLLHGLAGFVTPRAGRVWLEGRDVTGQSPYGLARARVALVPQGRRLFPELTVEEQLRLGARPGRWTVERVYRLFPRLKERRAVPGTSLSGGEQQMVAIGRALLRNPRLLLLDEPSEGLSPALIASLRNVMAALRDGGETIVLAEQNVPLALSVAHRVYVLERGRVIHEGPAREFAARPDLMHRMLGV